MLLHFEEFHKTHNEYVKGLIMYYHKLPEQIHLMENEDIIKHINRHGSTRAALQFNIVYKYLTWLHKQYNIDMSEKLYELKNLFAKNHGEYVGFFELEDLINGIEESLMTLETSDHPKAHADYDGLYAVFYLEWFGVKPQSVQSIMLNDVTDFGRKVYIPAEKRTVEITDQNVANYLWEYKHKDGEYCRQDKVKTPYKGDTFFRTTRPCKSGDVARQIYNARSRFIWSCEDIRFSKNNVYDSGRFDKMRMLETESNVEFKNGNPESIRIIREIFNEPNVSDSTVNGWMTRYRKYKKTYLSR